MLSHTKLIMLSTCASVYLEGQGITNITSLEILGLSGISYLAAMWALPSAMIFCLMLELVTNLVLSLQLVLYDNQIIYTQKLLEWCITHG